jgi:quinol monooxygenase YgiN
VYPLFSTLAAVLVWFGASRVGELPRRSAGRDGMRDGRDLDRSGNEPDDDYWPADGRRPAGDYAPEGQYATYGERAGPPGLVAGPPGPGGPRGTGDVPGAGPGVRSAHGRDRVRRADSGPQPRMPEWQDRHRGPRPGYSSADDRRPGAQAVRPIGAPRELGALRGLEGLPDLEGLRDSGGLRDIGGLRDSGGLQDLGGLRDEADLAGAEFGSQVSAGGSSAATPARPYGRILIFTLLEDRVADFDRLAEQAAEEVRTGEPETLVYVIHLVPNAPLQRIFYEIYRDRAAFASHETQPYMQRFVTERRSCVLATNVIELRLKYAKVAPLPNPQASAAARPAAPPPATRAQLPPGPLGPPQRLQPLPPGPLGPPAAQGLPGGTGPRRAPAPQRTQRLQPLPPVRPQRPDQHPDLQRPNLQRPDQQRPDQRQVPSAGRRYEG